jgi:hypothetical protein
VSATQPAWSEEQLLALIDWFDAGCNSLGAVQRRLSFLCARSTL